jgi:acid phosphatase
MRRVPAAVVAVLVVAGCAAPAPRDAAPEPTPAPVPDVRLHSVLWMQTAAEYANSTRQVFRMAAERLDTARSDPSRSAVTGVEADPSLPPAVIVDVDETILDNTPHAARSILARQGFDPERWRRWVNESIAPPVPGAVGYLRAAREAGVRVIYLTNRHHELEAATRRNLSALGCPIDERPGEDVVLTYRERPDWTGDKTSRRLWVAARYRVLQLLGDDLNDFVAVPARATVDYRRALSDRYVDRWGEDWFQLPNPLYGSWEQAVTTDGQSIFDSPLGEIIRRLETE